MNCKTGTEGQTSVAHKRVLIDKIKKLEAHTKRFERFVNFAIKEGFISNQTIVESFESFIDRQKEIIGGK